MKDSLCGVRTEERRIPVDERAALANTLLDTLDGTNESGSVHEAWDA